MKKKIGIIGDGNVGSALRKGLERAGHEVRAVGHDPKAVKETGIFADIIILAIPYSAVDEALKSLGDTVNGKPLVDVINPLTPDYQLALGYTTSGAEEIQKKAPHAKVVKAFNTVVAQKMELGKVKDQTLSAFVAGDDAGAKSDVLELAKGIGFDPIDAGPLKNARWVEALGYLNIQLAMMLKMGVETGWKFIH